MVIEAVKIEGLNEFGRAVKKVDSDLGKIIRVALNEAVEPISSEARRLVPSRSGRAKRSVKSQSTQKVARVVGGGSRAPYYPWLDFGGSVGRRGSVKRPFKKTGRYIFKVYGKKRDSGEFTKLLDEKLRDVGRQAGLVIERGE